MAAVRAVEGQEGITDPPDAIVDCLGNVFVRSAYGYILDFVLTDPKRIRLLKRVTRHLKERGV